MAMIPSDQQSTFGPYSFCLTTSGAIQYGVPTIVARLLRDSVSLAQKPKSAKSGKGLLATWVPSYTIWPLTDLNMASTIEENIVTLDIAVDDILAMQVGQSLAGLWTRKLSAIALEDRSYLYTRKTDLCADGRDLIFLDNGIIVDNIGESTALHEFHDHPKLVALLLQK